MKSYLLLFVAVLICCGCFPLLIDSSDTSASESESFASESEEVSQAGE